VGATSHAIVQVLERLKPEERKQLEARLQALPKLVPHGSAAVRILKLAAQRNSSWGEKSNGDIVVAVVRDAVVVTVMLRRSSQPWCTKSFDVDRVLVLD
jgi:hypothetical protein